jgi:hypothetical protein
MMCLAVSVSLPPLLSATSSLPAAGELARAVEHGDLVLLQQMADALG